MRFSNPLHFTRINKLHSLDIALLLSLLPHLYTLKLPMLIYLLLGLVFIIKGSHSKKVIISFALLGLIGIGLSFFAEYNFSNFSRLLVFISLLISLLSYAVVLQRLTREINFYLLISPALLMILSFFFFNSIPMLFYALFTLFVFTFLILFQRMHSSVKNALRINGLLYLFSLPIVLLLFLTFPRISYKNAKFGFKAEEVKRTGHDGTMHLDSNALLVPSPKLVMEISFEKEVPEEKKLYFRGSTLYVDKGSYWVRGNIAQSAAKAAQMEDFVNYRVKLYPHQKKWVYMLDMPLFTPIDSKIDGDFITTSSKNLFETSYYDARSALSYRMAPEKDAKLQKALRFDELRDERTLKRLHTFVNEQAGDRQKAQQLLAFFYSLELSYSLKPKPIDLKDPIDSFLFDSKIGYCVHFASAFATAARMVGIPSRIVTGYRADRSNTINNYLLIKEADAHAWVELYIKGRGWVRFEPTGTASQILTPQNRDLTNAYTKADLEDSFFQKSFKQINIYYMYSRYVINTWVLQYSRVKQMSLLKELLDDTLFLMKFVGAFIAFILLSFTLFYLLQKRQYQDPLMAEMQRLLALLKKRGYLRRQGETMYDFLQRVRENSKEYALLDEISRIYHKERYAKEGKGDPALLRAKILSFKKVLKNG